jgi:glycosyltransferase involved in cell wall biosynthesis
MPKISVIMPVYNVEKFVARSIKSVLRQNFKDFELILVDDGGNDQSLEICRGFKDPRIRIISQSNRGLAGARNTGIRNANGRYIALLDSDDLWHEDKLALHSKHLDANPSVGVSYSGSHFIDETDSSLGMSMTPKLTHIDTAHIFCRNPVGNGSAPVIRREVLKDIAFSQCIKGQIEWAYFDETFRFGEDIECWMRIACKTKWKFEGIEGDLTFYRIVSGGLSANTTKMYEFWNKMYAKVEAYAPEVTSQYGRRARAYQLRYYARRAVREGQGAKAVANVVRALYHAPIILIEEPKKTFVTLVAAILTSILPKTLFQRLEHGFNRR